MMVVRLQDPEHGHPILAHDGPAHASILVLAHDPVVEDYVTLTRAGGHVIAPAEAEPDHLVAILTAFLDGHAVLPLTTLYRLTAIARSSSNHPVLADAEVKWLTLLAQGRAVNDLAGVDHRSSRGMHRALAGLYQRLGVANRDQAVAWAARHGLLDTD